MNNNIKNIKAVIIDTNTDPNTNQSTNCILEYTVEYNDGSKEIFGAQSIEDSKGRIDTTRALIKLIKTGIPVEYYKSSNTRKMEEYNKYVSSIVSFNEESLTTEKDKKRSTKKLVAGAALATAAGVVGVTACGAVKTNGKENEDAINTTVSDAAAIAGVELSKPNMEGQNWDYYLENAIDNTQKQAWTKVGEFLINLNNSQEWMTRVNNSGNQSVFGLTPEEAMALHVRFNEYTDEELITIFNSMNINADEIMDLSNDAIEKLELYYMVSDQVSGIEVLFNDEHDQEVIKAFEEHHVKMMKAEGKEKEALMQEEKQMFSDYFNSDIEGKETKARAASTSYILRTILFADSNLSNVYQFEGKVTLDKISGGTVDAKTNLFDEIFMRRYVLGFENFNEENFIKNLGYNADKYTVLIDDVSRSIADISCGEQEEKLRDADEFRITLETSKQVVEDNREAIKEELTLAIDENGNISEAQLDNIINRMNQDNEQATIDLLTQYSYDPTLIAEMLSNKLEELNKTPMYADTFFEYYTELAVKIMDANSTSKTTSSSKKSSSKVIIETNNRDDAKNALINAGDTPAVAESKIVAAEEEAARNAGAERDTEETKKKHEEEAEKEEEQLEDIYDETFKAYANGYVGEYNSSWANSSNFSIKNTYAVAKQDGISNLYQTIYNAVYNYYVAGGTDEYNSSWANSNNETIREAYVAGKKDGVADYQPIIVVDPEIPEFPDVPEPTNPTPDVPPTDPPVNPEEPEETEEDDDDYAPIVDEPETEQPTDPIYWDDDDIIGQIEAEEETESVDEIALNEASYDMSILEAMAEFYQSENEDTQSYTLRK